MNKPTAALNVVDPQEAALRLLEKRPKPFTEAIERERERTRQEVIASTPYVLVWLDHGDSDPIKARSFRQIDGYAWWTRSDGADVGVPDHRVHKIEVWRDPQQTPGAKAS